MGGAQELIAVGPPHDVEENQLDDDDGNPKEPHLTHRRSPFGPATEKSGPRLPPPKNLGLDCSAYLKPAKWLY